MSEERTIGLGGLLIMALLVGGVCGWLLKPVPPCPCDKAASVLEYRVDTVMQPVIIPPLVLRTPATDTVYRDTGRVYTTPAFEARLDTIVGRDTLGVGFHWPEYTFDVAFRRAADSIPLVTRTFTITNTVVERRSLWLDILTHTGAAAIGYVVGANR
jgi:hypothetical protein